MHRDQCLPVRRAQLGCQVREHEGQGEDHEDEPAEHVVHEQHARDRKPRRVLGDESEQDHRRRKAAMPDDEVRQRGDAGEARPPDPGIAEVGDPRPQDLTCEDVIAKSVVLRVVQHRPGEKRPGPRGRSVRMRRDQVLVVVEGFELVVDQVGEVVKLPASEERVPGEEVNAQRDHHQREESNGHIARQEPA